MTRSLVHTLVPPRAGVMLGTNDEQLVGMHIGEILTGMAGAPIGNLFLPELGRGPKAISKMKGGLKQDTGEGKDAVPVFSVKMRGGRVRLTSHAPCCAATVVCALPTLHPTPSLNLISPVMVRPSFILQPMTRRPRRRSPGLSTPSRSSTSPTANRWASPCRSGGRALVAGEKKEAE